MKITRPMRAVTMTSLDDIRLPVYAGFKRDGIRCIKVDGKALSKSMKPIVNRQLRAMVENPIIPNGFDGELFKYRMPFQDIESIVMTEDADASAIEYHVFDWAVDNTCFRERQRYLDHELLYGRCAGLLNVVHAYYNMCHSRKELQDLYDLSIAYKHEGLVLRCPESFYKCGQSTMTKQEMVKWKPMVTGKAIVLCAVEQMTNTNAAFQSELGLSKRSHKKSGKIPAGTLGSLLVRDIDTNVAFSIGTGFDADLRAKLWSERASLQGRIVEYESQKCGVKEAPRCPVFKRFRNPHDVSL
jgi:DNA ligase-1